MKIKLFSHAVCLDGDISITKEQTRLLLESHLFFENNVELNFMLHYKKEDFHWLYNTFPEIPKSVNYKVFDESYKDWHEGTTIYHIQEMVHSTNDEFYICYMHHKGISSGQHAWRQYMQYWNIEKWRDCVAKLDEGYDLCGASFLNNPPHPFYAGNFFWARASYLRRCKRLKSPAENDFKPQFSGQPHHRYDYECWHGSGNPKAYDLHPGPENRWYWPPNMYQN